MLGTLSKHKDGIVYVFICYLNRHKLTGPPQIDGRSETVYCLLPLERATESGRSYQGHY